MKLLIHEVASLANISVRTLYYYDEIGLLASSEVSPSGYRYYTKVDIRRLKKILFYKELDIPLKTIKNLLLSNIDEKEILYQQKGVLELKRDRINRVIDSIDGLMRGEDEMSFDEFDMREIDNAIALHKQEVLNRWGSSNEYRTSRKRTQNYSLNEWKKIRSEDDAIISTFAALVGGDISDSKVIDTVVRWQNHISSYYYTCTDEILLSLAEMYNSDERFTKTLDRFKEGTAEFMSCAIGQYVGNRK